MMISKKKADKKQLQKRRRPRIARRRMRPSGRNCRSPKILMII